MNFNRSLLAVLVLGAFLIGGYFYYRYYSDTRSILQEEEIKALQADTEGGQTPESTLELFVDALEKEDIERASLYFSLAERENWKQALVKVKESGFLDEMALDIDTKTVVDPQPENDADTVNFVIKEGDETVSVIVLELNPYSKVWKIKSI
jgi:hypothetical protein